MCVFFYRFKCVNVCACPAVRAAGCVVLNIPEIEKNNDVHTVEHCAIEMSQVLHSRMKTASKRYPRRIPDTLDTKPDTC